jgi:quercetin dioxygenase-like cupin family protein
VLEGTVRSQLAGQPVRTYHQGQNWVEPPGAHHLLTDNTSPTKPAKLLVIFIANTGTKPGHSDAPNPHRPSPRPPKPPATYADA